MKLLYPTIEPHLSNTSPKLEVSFLILARRPSHQSNTFLNTKRNKEINIKVSLFEARKTPLKNPKKIYKEVT